MIVLVDYNLTGYIVLLQGTLASEGWLELRYALVGLYIDRIRQSHVAVVARV